MVSCLGLCCRAGEATDILALPMVDESAYGQAPCGRAGGLEASLNRRELSVVFWAISCRRGGEATDIFSACSELEQSHCTAPQYLEC